MNVLPYEYSPLSEAKEDGFHLISTDFMTEDGVGYQVQFINVNTWVDVSQFQDVEIFSFSFENDLPEGQKVADPRVPVTIQQILAEFLGSRNAIIHYTCSNDGDQKLARERKFKMWYQSAADSYIMYSYLSDSTNPSGGTMMYFIKPREDEQRDDGTRTRIEATVEEFGSK